MKAIKTALMTDLSHNCMIGSCQLSSGALEDSLF